MLGIPEHWLKVVTLKNEKETNKKKTEFDYPTFWYLPKEYNMKIKNQRYICEKN